MFERNKEVSNIANETCADVNTQRTEGRFPARSTPTYVTPLASLDGVTDLTVLMPPHGLEAATNLPPVSADL